MTEPSTERDKKPRKIYKRRERDHITLQRSGDTAYGNLVNKRRLEKGLTLLKLSQLSGVKFNYISQIENGHKWPCESIKKALSNALDIPESLTVRKAYPRAVLSKTSNVMKKDGEFVAVLDKMLDLIEANKITPEKLKALIAINK